MQRDCISNTEWVDEQAEHPVRVTLHPSVTHSSLPADFPVGWGGGWWFWGHLATR